MALSDELEALAKRHGALSYRNRADTQNPAFGFSAAGLESLVAEVRKDDEALIWQLVDALEQSQPYVESCANGKRVQGWGAQLDRAQDAITAGRARLMEGKP